MLVVVVGCGKTSEPANASSVCDVKSTDHDTLFRRGADLVGPHMLLVDRKPPPRNDDEVRVGIACLDRVLEMDPMNWSALWIRGKGFQSLGDHGSAVASFRSAYRLKPDHQDVARELAEELIETQQFGEAVTVAREVSTRHPDDAGLAANLALALVMNGDVAGARQAIGDALRLDPNDAITKLLAKRIAEIADGSRPQPKSLGELQRGL
jgi:Flp pilus assembly protein TadD